MMIYRITLNKNMHARNNNNGRMRMRVILKAAQK